MAPQEKCKAKDQMTGKAETLSFTWEHPVALDLPGYGAKILKIKC